MQLKMKKNKIDKDHDLYPSGFTQNIKSQLDEIIVGKDSIVQVNFEISGIDVDPKYLNAVEQTLRSKTSDEALISDLMQRVGHGIASMKQLENDLKYLKRDLEDDYESDLEYLKDLKKQRGRDVYELRKEIRSEILESMQEDIEAVLEDIDVNLEGTSRNNKPDRALKNYVDEIRKNKLHEKEDQVSKSSDTELSNANIASIISEMLPSNLYDNRPFESNSIGHVPFSEYIMGTFRHRLSATMENDWDFYKKNLKDNHTFRMVKLNTY